MRIEDYGRYLAAVNDRDWTVVAEYVAPQVQVNGRATGRAGYLEDLRRLSVAHPDHHWEISDLLRDGDRIAVRLATTRTVASGFELAHYRWADEQIVEVWSIGTEPTAEEP